MIPGHYGCAFEQDRCELDHQHRGLSCLPFYIPDERREGTVSLWWAELDLLASAIEDLRASLSAEERRRAERFSRALDRGRFIAARVALRYLLAHQLRCFPAEVPIVTDDRGKPRLAGSELHFSAARSCGVALYATSWSMEVGVDIEAIRDKADLDRIAARFFTSAERRELASLPSVDRLVAGFQCWTRKEAYAKATGDGLTFALEATHVGVDGHCIVAPCWSVHQVDLVEGFAAAVAGSSAEEWTPVAAGKIQMSDRDRLAPEKRTRPNIAM